MSTVALIVAAHGNFAEALLDSAAMIAGKFEKVKSITFASSEGPDDLLAKYDAALSEMGEKQVLFLVDLFGGSPYNAAARYVAPRGDADIVTGVSLPMLIEVISGRWTPGATLDDLARTARQAGLEAVHVFSQEFIAPTNTSTEEGDDL